MFYLLYNVSTPMKYQTVKNDFQSILHSLSTLMFINTVSSHSMECESMLFFMNHIPYLSGLSSYFSNSFTDVYSWEVVSSSDMKRTKHIALTV